MPQLSCDACLTAKSRIAGDIDLDHRPLMLCLDAVIHAVVSDNSFTDVAVAVYNHFKCQCSQLIDVMMSLCLFVQRLEIKTVGKFS